MKNENEWWRGAVLYQIYPRSFYDTNGDGVGDLPGITEKLDYVAGLGVEGIWISPFFKSPMKDYGYDVSDYRDVDPLFGTLADFRALLDRAHGLGLKVILDLVLSHTSDRHPWFSDPGKEDWYVWADARPDGSPPNNWVSIFGGPAWEWSAEKGRYYLHHFLKEQPDLNFHNPAVQEEALDTARFWLDMGVDGLRLDVVNFYFHDPLLRDNPPRASGTIYATQFEGEDPYSAQQHVFDKSRPENVLFLRRLRALTDEYEGCFMVGEIGDDHPYARAAEYTAAGEGLLHTSYNPYLMGGRHKPLTAALIREPFETLAAEPGDGWPSWAFSNHDVVRAASRWHGGGDGFSADPRLSAMLVVLLGCLRGTMFLYQGEELGLPEARLDFADLRDPWGKHLWPAWQGRDGCRTPVPWTDGPHGGFSGAVPWLPVPPAHLKLNAAAQRADPGSVLNRTRHFLAWRKGQVPLVLGDLAFSDAPDGLLAFTRSWKGEAVSCLFNLTGEAASLPGPLRGGQPVYGDEDTAHAGDTLAPYGYRLFKAAGE